MHADTVIVGVDNKELARAVETRFRQLESDCTAADKAGRGANDRFFSEQVAAWERDDSSFLDDFDGGSGLIDQLRQNWLANARAYVEASVGETAAANMFDDERSR